MDTDDLEPARPVLEPVNFEIMSIEALGDYISTLEAEIDRARAAIADKQDARGAAESFFKT